MLLNEGALLWPTNPATAPPSTDPDVWARAVAEAVDYLWSATARTYGTRTATYRPQTLGCTAGYRDAVPYLYGLYGFVVPTLNGRADPSAAVLELPGPANSIAEVQLVDDVGTVTLPASSYRLDGNYLVRTDGIGWPRMQNLIADDGDANTWHVIYDRGAPVPPGGQIAAYELAIEWVKKLTGADGCKLPWNVTTVSRAGVTINRDITKMLTTTNVEAADRWVARVNPQGLQQQPSVWSPDIARNGRPYAGSGVPYVSPGTPANADRILDGGNAGSF